MVEFKKHTDNRNVFCISNIKTYEAEKRATYFKSFFRR